MPINNYNMINKDLDFYKKERKYSDIISKESLFLLYTVDFEILRNIISKHNKRASNILEFVMEKCHKKELKYLGSKYFALRQLFYFTCYQLAHHLHIMIATDFVHITTDFKHLLDKNKIMINPNLGYNFTETYYIENDDDYLFKCDLMGSEDGMVFETVRFFPENKKYTDDEIDKIASYVYDMLNKNENAFDLLCSPTTNITIVKREAILELFEFTSYRAILEIIQKYDKEIGNFIILKFFDFYCCISNFFIEQIKLDAKDEKILLVNEEILEEFKLFLNLRIADYITHVINNRSFSIPEELYIIFKKYNIEITHITSFKSYKKDQINYNYELRSKKALYPLKIGVNFNEKAIFDIYSTVKVLIDRYPLKFTAYCPEDLDLEDPFSILLLYMNHFFKNN